MTNINQCNLEEAVKAFRCYGAEINPVAGTVLVKWTDGQQKEFPLPR